MRVYITGITGTLGTALTKYHHSKGDQVWGCARNESKAVEWLRQYGNMATLYLQCVSNLLQKTDSGRVLPTMDRVYHCAAMKHVDLCEQQPEVALVQNIAFTNAVAVACAEYKVPLIFASTDKACQSQGVYGATKLIAERIVLKNGGAVVRLVNLIGSSGSVFQVWQQQVKVGKPLTITDPDMTRYFMPVRFAADFMANCAIPGKVVIPCCRSVRMGDVAYTLAHPHTERVKVIGTRPGETKQQWLVPPGGSAKVEECFRYILNEGSTFLNGKNSDEGPFWDIQELLSEASSNEALS